MPSPFFIQSKLGNLVIDIQGGSTKPGTFLDAFTKKTKSPDRDNQLWTFASSSYADYYFIQSVLSDLVIDVHMAGTTPGTPLDVFTRKTKYPDLMNQLWMFVPSEVAGYYFIQSVETTNLVIDVQGAGTKPGTPLDAFTQKTKSPGWDNQLWAFIDEDGNSLTPPPYPA